MITIAHFIWIIASLSLVILVIADLWYQTSYNSSLKDDIIRQLEDNVAFQQDRIRFWRDRCGEYTKLYNELIVETQKLRREKQGP